MNPPWWQRLLLGAAFGAVLVAHGGEGPAKPPPATKGGKDSSWAFSLLPKSLQKNPNLELSFITELTAAGKKLPTPSSAAPAYYVSQSTALTQLGEEIGRIKPIPTEQLDAMFHRALAAAGYLPAEPAGQRPTLAIVYNWGAHNKPSTTDAAIRAEDLFQRAMLVGGEKFTKEFVEVLEQTAALNSLPNPGPPDENTPLAVFRRKSDTNDFLVDQLNDDLYFAVASAFDYDALAHGKRVLLWRTRMTVSAAGVALDQSLPAVIATAGPYFGREMTEPSTVVRRVKEGRVEIGPAAVVEPEKKR